MSAIVRTIVVAIIAILISVAIPFYQKSILRSNESVRHNNLSAMRNAIDEYCYDKQKAPRQLQDLVSGGYLLGMPKGPIARGQNVFDVCRKSQDQAGGGILYAEW